MAEAQEDARLERVAQKIDPRCRLVRAWPLAGGVSAQVTALEIERPGGARQTLVVRRHGAADLASNPRIAADELRLLAALREAGLPAPAPRLADESGEIFATPYIVVEYIDGAPEFAPADLDDTLRQLAAALAAIHRVDWAARGLAFLPRRTLGAMLGERPAEANGLGEGRAWDILRAAQPVPQRNAPALLHGDYWPGNVLWREGRLVGVIDWEDAAIGDPLADLANIRLEALWAFGRDAVRRLTEQYQAAAPIDLAGLAHWDLSAALRSAGKIGAWGLEESAERAMRDGLRWFIAQALDAIEGR